MSDQTNPFAFGDVQPTSPPPIALTNPVQLPDAQPFNKEKDALTVIQLHGEFCQHTVAAIQKAYHIGSILLRAKDALPSAAAYTKFITKDCCLKDRMASYYCRIAANYGRIELEAIKRSRDGKSFGLVEANRWLTLQDNPDRAKRKKKGTPGEGTPGEGTPAEGTNGTVKATAANGTAEVQPAEVQPIKVSRDKLEAAAKSAKVKTKTDRLIDMLSKIGVEVF